MRKIILIIILIGSFSVAHSQTFKGTVYDRSTDSPLGYALVYISGTSIGSFSDINGNFTLDISQNSSMPITISLLGYYSVDILNENDLRFSYNSDDSVTLKAFSSRPILIHNKALGYTITYYLNKFNFSSKRGEKDIPVETTKMLGNYLFKDDLFTLSESEKRKVEEKRKRAYLGSRMHFFSLLYKGNLIQNGKYTILLSDNTSISSPFSIGSKTTINADSLVIRKDSISSYFKNEGELGVRFRMKHSKFTVKMDSVYFDKNGYFDPDEIAFEGDMARQRIGDLLPFEYLPK